MLLLFPHMLKCCWLIHHRNSRTLAEQHAFQMQFSLESCLVRNTDQLLNMIRILKEQNANTENYNISPSFRSCKFLCTCQKSLFYLKKNVRLLQKDRTSSFKPFFKNVHFPRQPFCGLFRFRHYNYIYGVVWSPTSDIGERKNSLILVHAVSGQR